ncbi:MAG: DUF349 domain-containing protein [Actinomycetia bacterium]|nr:DUF349 domain-containing protein [Actinomycetes bacterium]
MSEASPSTFGRVDEDGSVFVTTSDGERMVGQVPGATPDEALAFFTRRFDALQTEVALLEERVRRGALGPDEARKSIAAVRSSIEGANAVGDLAGLLTRLESLAPAIAEAREARKAQRARVSEETRQAKEAMVAEAERIAESNDWRGGVNRFRSLLDEWKLLPRIDRTTDDELWHRFSAARTTYTRRRKAQFAEQNERREQARQLKEQIIAEARELAQSTDWGATAGAFRELMGRWKAAGVAPRAVDDALWAEFRGIQDDFFARRHQVFSEQDTEFQGNLEAKLALLSEAEAAILPVENAQAARQAFRTFLSRYNEHGKVPRDSVRGLESRVRSLETAIKKAEDEEWRRTDPETHKRAAGTASLLTDQISKLEADLARAESRGDRSKASELRQSIETYRSWLDQANKTLRDFEG